MTRDETEIRTLIERWAKAVHSGDMDGVLADHADHIVMFDVPPPEDGVRGIDAYRETWPPFFKWQKLGAAFEIGLARCHSGRGRRLRICLALLRDARRDQEGPRQSPAPDNRAAQGRRPLGRGA